MGYKHNKEDILATGYDVFRKRGYHNVGINEILKASKLPKGSFYNFFESKEDFANQVIAHYGSSTKTWLQEYFSKNTPPYELIKNFYADLIGYNEEDGYASGCLISNMSNEIGKVNANLAAAANQHFTSWIEVIAGTVQKGQDKGEITTMYSAMELAEYLHAGFSGTFARMKVTNSRDYMDVWYKLTMDFIKG